MKIFSPNYYLLLLLFFFEVQTEKSIKALNLRVEIDINTPLQGLSHEIFTVIFWLEWIYIGLKGNHFWFLNFKDVSSILDSNFKY